MPHIRQELIIGAAAEKVFHALTTGQDLSRWWTSNAKATPELGSTAHFPFGDRYFKEMRIEALEPSNLVSWLCTAGVDQWVGTHITFSLDPGGKDALLKAHDEIGDQIGQQEGPEPYTLLKFSHDDWKDYTPMFAECSFTWGRFLRSLKALCETGRGHPWPHQHQA